MPLMVANAMGSGWIFPGLHAGRQAHRAEERVAERDLRRNRPSELTTVDEAEKSEHRAGEKLQAVIDEPGARELCRAHLSGRGAGRIERAVHLELAPRRDVRNDGEHYGGRVALRGSLEGLRADHHADIEQDP